MGDADGSSGPGTRTALGGIKRIRGEVEIVQNKVPIAGPDFLFRSQGEDEIPLLTFNSLRPKEGEKTTCRQRRLCERRENANQPSFFPFSTVGSQIHETVFGHIEEISNRVRSASL